MCCAIVVPLFSFKRQGRIEKILPLKAWPICLKQRKLHPERKWHDDIPDSDADPDHVTSARKILAADRVDVPPESIAKANSDICLHRRF